MNGVIDSDLAVSATIWMFGGAAVGLLAGPLAGWLWRTPQREGFPMGLFVFMLIFGAAASSGALRLAHASWQFHQASVAAPGTLVEFVSGSYYDSKKKRNVPTRSPRVEFAAADGTRHSFKGLAGSLTRREPGSAVTVRYRPEQPAVAAVADFQSQWGAAWAFGLFGGAGLLLAWTLGLSLFGPPERPSSGRWGQWRLAHGQRARREFGRMGTLMLVLSIASPMTGWTEDVGAAIATALCGVGSAFLCLGVGKALDKDSAALRALSAGVAAALAAGYFGLGVWALTRP